MILLKHPELENLWRQEGKSGCLERFRSGEGMLGVSECFFFEVLEIELGALRIPDKCSITELHPQPFILGGRKCSEMRRWCSQRDCSVVKSTYHFSQGTESDFQHPHQVAYNCL